MIRKEIDLHLEALAGYINDEDKLVTYKWLSKELNIHVNLSKKILFEYWDEHRGKKNAIDATFLLIGNLEDGGLHVEVVKEADIASAKNKFSRIISEHIYSLQKTLPEIEMLAIADKGDSQHSAVRCADSVLRSEHEMGILRWGTAASHHKPSIIVPQSAPKAQERVNSETKPIDQAPKSVKESVAKTTAVKPAVKTQKSAFNNLFARAVEKQNKEKASAPSSAGGTKNKTASTNGSTSSSAPKNSWYEVKKKPESTKNKNDEVEEMEIDEETKKPVVEAKEKSPEIEKKVAKKETPEKISSSVKSVENKKVATSTSRGKKRQSSSKDEGKNKRRKRIVVAISSDESSDSEVQEIDDLEEPEEVRVPEKARASPSPPPMRQEGGRRKIRKLVDKTCKDENGFFITTKEQVYESCSDQEEEKPVEIVKPATVEPAAKNNNKRKQASLLNFFKKS